MLFITVKFIGNVNINKQIINFNKRDSPHRNIVLFFVFFCSFSIVPRNFISPLAKRAAFSRSRKKSRNLDISLPLTSFFCFFRHHSPSSSRRFCIFFIKKPDSGKARSNMDGPYKKIVLKLLTTLFDCNKNDFILYCLMFEVK